MTAITENSTTSALTISTNALTVNSGGTTLTNSAGTGLLTLSGGVVGTGNLILNNNSATAASVTVSTTSANNSGSITSSGSGAGGVTIRANVGSNVTAVVQNSPGSTLTLSGTNTYSGGTQLTGGTLSVANDTNLAPPPAASLSTVVRCISAAVSRSVPRAITVNSAGGTLTGPAWTGGRTATLASSISGTGRLTIVGSVNQVITNVVFSGNNSSFSGGVNIDSGTVEFDGVNSAGSGPLSFTSNYYTDTVKLRNDATATFPFPAVNFPQSQGNNPYTIDVNQLSTGHTNQTISLASVHINGLDDGQTEKFNVTGGNGYALNVTWLMLGERISDAEPHHGRRHDRHAEPR